MDVELKAKIKKAINKYDEIGEKEFLELSQMFGGDNVNEVLFDQDEEDDTLEEENLKNFEYSDPIKASCTRSLLTPDAEKKYATIIAKYNYNLRIEMVEKCDTDVVFKLNYGLLFGSIKDVEDIKLLKILNKYRDVRVLSEQEREPIRKYLKWYNDNNQIPTIDELHGMYPDLFFGNHSLSNIELKKEILALVELRIAKTMMMESNMRLVAYIAKHHIKNNRDMEDLFQMGIPGLYKAVNRFDVTREVKFSTYATWWIEQSINRSLDDTDRIIRLPANLSSKVKKAKYLIYKEVELLGRELTDSEKSLISGLSVEILNDVDRAENLVRLDSPFGNDSDLTLLDIIEDRRPSTEEIVTESIKKESILNILNEIFAVPDKELKTPTGLKKQKRYDFQKLVIIKRFGLDGSRLKKLEAIGKEHHLTRERIRQIESKALKRLRSSAIPGVKQLKDFYK